MSRTFDSLGEMVAGALLVAYAHAYAKAQGGTVALTRPDAHGRRAIETLGGYPVVVVDDGPDGIYRAYGGG